MLPKLDVESLRVLVTVAELGGVTRASERLTLTQSAVSHKLRRLERAVGCDLLTRRSGAQLLTEEGQRLLSYARRIVALHDEAALSLVRQPLSGRIRLGMTEDVTSSDLSRILGRFTRLYPDISVRTQVRQSLVLQDELKRGEIDLSLMQVFSHQLEPGDILLYSDPLYWVSSHDLFLPPSGPVPFLAYDDRCFFYQWALQQHELEFETVLQCASSAGISSAVQAGLGVSLLPGRYVTPEMAILGDPFPAPPELSYIVRTGRRMRSRPVAALAREIGNSIERGAALRAV